MAITVHCPSCSTAFPVDPAKVPEEGVDARCSVCQRIFPVERSGRETPAGEAEGAAPGEELPGPAETDTADFAVGSETLDEEPEPVEGLVSEGEMDPTDTFPPVELEDADPDVAAAPAAEAEQAGAGSAAAEEEPAAEAGDGVGTAPAAGVEGAEPAPRTEPATETDTANPFLQRDPRQRAARLARVLVSDMIMYNPDRHARALEQGTLEEDFEEEIEKSWKEYVEQVGEEVAEDTTYFNDALNEILARGEQVF